MSEIRTFPRAIEALHALNVGVVGQGSGRHERPHKPVLLLAAMDLIAGGRAAPDRIPWTMQLRERFAVYFDVLRQKNDESNPDLPFYHLRGDGFWTPIETQDGVERPLANTPTVRQAQAGTVFARIAGCMERILRTREQRLQLREALIARYFPSARLALTALFLESAAIMYRDGPTARAAEEAVEFGPPGRSSAFRRKLLEVYDYQCVACGLRIKLPERDISIVDAAHLIPFEETRNDPPANGLALCKNHHWAMDRFILVPTPERVWKVSPLLDARRSPGKRELLSLDGQKILPPHEEAFFRMSAGSFGGRSGF